MKNKGFTLAELLAVIVIMALLLTIAVPSVIGISNKIKTNMFCSKIEDIESAAKLYGEDYRDEIPDTGKTITVYNLIENNLFKKEDNNCDKSTPYPNSTCVQDPRNGSALDAKTIKITIKNKRVFAEYQLDEADKNVCKK